MEIAIIWKALSSYGVLGLMTVVLMAVVAKLYRDREAERVKHAAELAAFRDRYDQKTERYAEKMAAVAYHGRALAGKVARARRATGSDAEP
jgi:hypothetical protein